LSAEDRMRKSKQRMATAVRALSQETITKRKDTRAGTQRTNKSGARGHALKREGAPKIVEHEGSRSG